MQRSAYLSSSVSPATVRALNYSHEVEVLRKKVGESADVSFLDEIVEVPSSSSYIFRQVDCSPEFGEEILTQTDMFAAEPSGRTVRRELMPDPEARRIQRGQILIAGAGQMEENNLFGRSIISDSRLIGKILCGDAIMLRGDEEDDKFLFLYAFLCSRTGIKFVRSTAYGSSIPRPRLDLLKTLPIPIPNKALLKKVAVHVRKTITNRETYLEEIQAARACIEELPEMQEAIEMCQERKGRCVLWDGELPTMTGWTYASLGGALSFLRKTWNSNLADFLKPHGMSHGGRFTRTPCLPPYGIDFLSQRDLYMIRPVPQRIAPIKGVDLRIQEGIILVAGDGQLNEGSLFGKATIVTADLAGSAATEHAVRIYPLEDYKELVYAFLSTGIGLRLLRSTAFGTSIPKLNTKLASKLPFPSLTSEAASVVKTKAEAAIQARVRASNAEKEAVRIIEEEVLPEWLA